MSESVDNHIDIIDKLYSKMNPRQKESFLLGRIYTLLESGNAMSESFNDAIKNSEDLLKHVQDVIKRDGPELQIKRKTVSKKRGDNK